MKGSFKPKTIREAFVATSSAVKLATAVLIEPILKR